MFYVILKHKFTKNDCNFKMQIEVGIIYYACRLLYLIKYKFEKYQELKFHKYKCREEYI